MGQGQYLSTDPTAGEPLGAQPSIHQSVLPGLRGPSSGPEDAGSNEGIIGRLMQLLEPMAHPQSISDIGSLMLTPTDATRGALQQVPNAWQMLGNLLPSRQGMGSAVERLGQELQQPTKIIGRGVEEVGKRIKGVENAAASPVGGAMRRTAASAPAAGASVETPALTPSAPPASAPARVPQTLDQLVLTNEERTALDRLVQQGYSRRSVMKRILEQRQQVAPEVKAAPATGVQKPTLNAAEAKEFQRLKRAGKSDVEAFDLIRQMRAMTERLGLPTSEQTRQSVFDRNLSGRWPE